MSYWDSMTTFASESWDSVTETDYFDLPADATDETAAVESGDVWDDLSGYASNWWDDYNEPDPVTSSPTIAAQPVANSGLSAGIAGFSWGTIASIVTVLGFLFMLYRKLK